MTTNAAIGVLRSIGHRDRLPLLVLSPWWFYRKIVRRALLIAPRNVSVVAEACAPTSSETAALNFRMSSCGDDGSAAKSCEASSAG